MVTFLRFVGVTNAAIWFGSMTFFTFFVGPGFFSPQMKALLGQIYTGAAAQVMIERYFWLQIGCASIALLHLLAEKLYTGKPPTRLATFAIPVLLLISILGLYVIEPQMKQLHLKKYALQTTAAQKADAARKFGIMHGVTSAVNIVLFVTVFAYFWQTTNSAAATRRAR